MNPEPNASSAMPRIYTRGARWYDLLSGEPIYRAGRRAGIELLRPRRGDTVLDIGCGIGLNFPALVTAVGPEGRIIGLDRSSAMLAVAREKASRRAWRNVTLVHADSTDFGHREIGTRRVDAVLSTYALSVVGDPRLTWANARSVLRSGGRASIVDMQPPTGAARLLAPIARLACAAGGADLAARPWVFLERDGSDLRRRVLRGGHIVAVGATIE